MKHELLAGRDRASARAPADRGRPIPCWAHAAALVVDLAHRVLRRAPPIRARPCRDFSDARAHTQRSGPQPHAKHTVRKSRIVSSYDARQVDWWWPQGRSDDQAYRSTSLVLGRERPAGSRHWLATWHHMASSSRIPNFLLRIRSTHAAWCMMVVGTRSIYFQKFLRHAYSLHPKNI